MIQKTVLFLIIIALFVSSLASCSLFVPQNSVFDGGQMLDNELLSEIRADVLGTQEESEKSIISSQIYVEIATESETASASHTEKETKPQASIAGTDKAESTESYQSEESVSALFWTEGGEVWHTSDDCRYLKNKTVISGAQSDALAAGKKRLCSSCAKESH